jgi:protein-S-isoprenylcysteine O-methyltransferase Ste14
MLGSWPAAIAAAIGTLALVGRTAKEDAFLRRELTGYAEYATRVRYRLLPYVY